MVETRARLAERAGRALAEFFRLEAASGLVLVLAGAVGMVLANSPWSDAYEAMRVARGGPALGPLDLNKPFVWWINDALMAVFFLLVALELKREFVDGQFSDRRQLLLPLVCALGGMLAPMAIFVLANRGDAQALRGFAIPSATDIAFALGVLTLLGSRVPFALKLLLTAIAVLDDLGAIVIIAVFYSDSISLGALLAAATMFGGLLELNRRGVESVWPYLAVGLVFWLAVYLSGVHPTLAGVALGFAIPARARGGGESLLARLERGLHRWVAFVILPLFAFANAGVPLAGLTPRDLLAPVPLGIAAGLFVGKQLGVFLAGWAWIRLGRARLPEGVGWGALYGMAVLCGIGFTMSLFLDTLSFAGADPALERASRLGILSGSLLSALAGLVWLRLVLPAPRR